MFRLGSSLFIAVLCFAGTSAMAQSTANLTDPQIAHIAYTAGEIDIAAADLALKKTSNNAVKAFANEMVRDHTAVKQKGTSIVPVEAEGGADQGRASHDIDYYLSCN